MPEIGDSNGHGEGSGWLQEILEKPATKADALAGGIDKLVTVIGGLIRSKAIS